jgi:hypothetical protein
MHRLQINIQADNDIDSEGATFVSVGIGLDKTTVSVGTGNTEFHPVYAIIPNVDNALRRAHQDAVVPIAFLAIPKSEIHFLFYCVSSHLMFVSPADRAHTNSDEFRRFRKQLYHDSLAQIMAPLREFMKTPDIIRFPDRHYRRAIYGIGPCIADYPEQVMLASVVQGWCPKSVFFLITSPDN